MEDLQTTSVRRDGSRWKPEFIESIDQTKCLGCGRCYKACAHNVLTLIELEDEDDDDMNRSVMTIASSGQCIGCKACSKSCPKNCITHAA
ncbi:ferredoxin III, nif-specific [Chrysiogenes arsenatis]|uniref:ferredoxin III, nif-specific n=1 Tax=Chrysiogenes arsenatis TaxID=309797 RepID=UPI00041E6AB1|nr:ferredoxin III, nif-specific [Chrysiogenes arsenatis]